MVLRSHLLLGSAVVLLFTLNFILFLLFATEVLRPKLLNPDMPLICSLFFRFVCCKGIDLCVFESEVLVMHA